MTNIDISLDNDLLLRLAGSLERVAGKNGSKIMPQTTRAFDSGAKMIRTEWRSWAMGGDLSGAKRIKNPSPRLSASIGISNDSTFTRNIGTNSRQMERIQSGSPEFDMKTVYPYARKGRVSKDRVPYLIIPFRWGAPRNAEGEGAAHFGNTVPAMIWQFLHGRMAKQSVRTGKTYITENYSGVTTERDSIAWGARVTADGMANGMVKMKRNGGGSTYFTFRVISVKSRPGSWIRKSVPANDVIGAIEKKLSPAVSEIIAAGITSDLGL